jgi:hypothetical protein
MSPLSAALLSFGVIKRQTQNAHPLILVAAFVMYKIWLVNAVVPNIAFFHRCVINGRFNLWVEVG